MANEINAADFDIVGQGVNETPDPTKVPRAGQVSSQATAAMPGAPAPAQAAPTEAAQDAAPAGEAFDPSNFEIDPNDYEIDPDYANGSTPDFSINSSPLDVVDRFKLALGNKEGNKSYLKNKYEDVREDASGNFKVKKDGLWYDVDPSGLGQVDPWEVTKLIAKVALPRGLGALLPLDPKIIKEGLSDLADITPMAASIAAGTAGGVGGGIAGPVGSVAGAAAASGGVEAARTSLGRLVGTYEAAPEQQLKDIGWESMMGMGGQAIALGAKPTVKILEAALSKLRGTTNLSKELVSSMASATNGKPKWAMRWGMDDAQLPGEVKEALKKIGPSAPPEQAVGVLRQGQIADLRAIAAEGQQALQKRYTSNVGNLIKQTPEDYALDLSDATKGVMTNLVESGLGKIDEKGLFQALSDKEIARFMQMPESNLPSSISMETVEAVRNIARTLNRYSRFSSVSGKNGAQKALTLRRSIQEDFEAIGQRYPSDQFVQKIVGQAKNGLFERIGQSFADKGVAEPFERINKEYASHINAVKMVQDAFKSDNAGAVDALLNKFASKAGANQVLKDEVWSLSELVGGERVQRIIRREAAKHYLDFFPSPTGVQSNLLSAVGRATAGSTVSSPRAMARNIELGHRFNDMLKGLARSGKALAEDETATAAAMQTLAQSGDEVGQQFRELMQQAGLPDVQIDE